MVSYHTELFATPPIQLKLQQPLVYYSLLAVVFGCIIKSMAAGYFQRRKMPPGPTGIPILGNALQLPSKMAWIRFTEWKNEYGNFFYFAVITETPLSSFTRRSYFFSEFGGSACGCSQ
jgi:hypothetical protein